MGQLKSLVYVVACCDKKGVLNVVKVCDSKFYPLKGDAERVCRIKNRTFGSEYFSVHKIIIMESK